MTMTIEKSMLKERINAALEGTGLCVTYVNINPYKIQSTREAFDTHEDLYEDMLANIDNVTVYGRSGRALWEHIASNNTIYPECVISDAPSDIVDFIRDVLTDIVECSPEVALEFRNELCAYCEENEHELYDEIKDKDTDHVVFPEELVDSITNSFTFEDLEEFTPELMKRIENKLYDWDWSNVDSTWGGDDHPCLDADNYGNERDEVENLFGIDINDCQIEMGDSEMESLSYWTIYFEPLRFDAEIAERCRLTPFLYNSDNREYELLALGGCGMDLSPKLDAYQALTLGTIPGDSMFIRQYDYAVHVVGPELAEEVMATVTRKTPEVTIELGQE